MYPCVFGCFSLSESPIKFNHSEGIVTLYDDGRGTKIYKKGESKEIHFHKEKNTFALIFGRVYSPMRITPYEINVKKNLITLSNNDFNKVQGSFTAIIKSSNEEIPKFKLFTDKYGFRRLLYYHKNNCLYFSTHFSGLKMLLNNKLPAFSIDALLHYYNFGFTPNNQTIFDGIKKVPPGSYICVGEDKYSIETYFQIEKYHKPEKYEDLSEKEICTILDNMLLNSIKARISNKENVGMSLSGGVDSGYIAQKLVEYGLQPRGYNLSYKNYYNEFDRIDYLTKLLDIKVRKIILTPKQIIDNFEYCCSISSEPLGFNNATMRFVAINAQKDGVTDLFDGDGADRLFLGMSRYLKLQKIIRAYDFLKKAKIINLVIPVLDFFPGNELKKISIHFKNWKNGLHPYPERKLEGLLAYDCCYEQKIFNLAIRQYPKFCEQKFPSNDFWQCFSYYSIKMCPEMFFYDPSEIQTELGLFPIPTYWDDELVSLAMSLFTSWKLRMGIAKYILRKAASQYLDNKYWMQPKIGLQDSFNYVAKSEIGRRWLVDKHNRIKDMAEYKILSDIIPNNKVEKNKLINLLIWKEMNV